MEIIEQIYNRSSSQLPYITLTEDDRYNSVVIAATERIEKCLGVKSVSSIK